MNATIKNEIIDLFPEVLEEVKNDLGYFTIMAETLVKKRD